MALRATKHKFTGATTPIASYDYTKTCLGTLMVQNTGTNREDKYAGPLPVGVSRPMQEVVHTGNVATVSATVVTGSGTNFTTSMNGMAIGFGSTDPAKVTTWYTLGTWTSTTVIAISTGPTISVSTPFVIVFNFPMMYPHTITYSATIDFVFLVENSAAASTARRICLYEFNKTTAIYTWKGFINITLPSAATNANTIRGFRALRYLHTNGTAAVATATVTGTGTTWLTDRLAIGARIGFGSTDPTQISTWYYVNAVSSDTSLTIQTNVTAAGTGGSAANITISPTGPYVIEEFRFALAVSQVTTPQNGGLFLTKGVSYGDFVQTGFTIAAAVSTDSLKAVYWLCDAGNAGNVVTNQAACGCAIQSEVNKGVQYAYVLDGFGSAYLKVYRYNLRATGAIASGKMTMDINYYTAGTVSVSGTGVTGAGGATFTSAMVGMKIGFGSASPALITTWYTIETYTDSTHIVLSGSAPTLSGVNYIIDYADVICTGNELVAGTVSTTFAAVNNGRIGTLAHGPGAGIESLYFVTSTRIYRSAMTEIYSGNLDWISDNRPEIPTGGPNSFPATGALNVVEIADQIDRLIVLSTGATAFRNYVTDYSDRAGDPFDHIWGVDDKQQDQIQAGGNAYISSGTVAVTGTAVTGTNTFFTTAMVGFTIGFGSTDPTAITTWYTISSWTSLTAITLSASAGSVAGGSAYVIDMNSDTVSHFNTSSQPTNIWSQNGIAHIAKQGTTALLNQLYSLPLAAHWTYADNTNQRIITPVLYTPDCAKFRRVVVVDQDRLGSGEFAITPEPFRLYFRTKGIYDNSGHWTFLEKDDDLSGLMGAPRIQFMFEFVTIGWFCVPARIMSIAVIYDDTVTTTDSHYQPSAAMSNASGKIFAWRFATAFSASVPTLRVLLYDALTGDLLIEDNSATFKGKWEKTTNGGSSWALYNNDSTDKGNETTYLRYTPPSLGDNMKVRAVLTQ